MEEEIDLRPYIEALVKRWYWILGAAILAGVVAFFISSFIPPSYEAKALVAVIPSNDVVQFDARFRENTENQPLRAFPQLAMSDQVLQTLLSQGSVEAVTSVEDLRKKVEAETGEDATILKLTVISRSPIEAASLANTWAVVFVEWANNVYGEQGGEQVRFFEGQLSAAETELMEAEEALVDFQAINRTKVISNTLVSYNNNQAMLLASQNQANSLLQDVKYLRDQLAEQSNSEMVTFADQFTALSLQLQVFNVDTAVPLQFQVETTASLTGDSRVEQLAKLDMLLTTLNLRVDQIDNELSELEPQILALQQQLQESKTEYGRLLRNQIIAEETHNALARKVEEERITSADTTTGVRLASEAAVPTMPVSTGSIMIVATAFVLGGLVSTGLIVVNKWWKDVQSSQE